MKRLITFGVCICVLLTSLFLAAVPLPSSNFWTPTADMGLVRTGASATLLEDGRVLIAGGIDENSAVTTTSERFSPADGGFAPSASMQTARANHTATLLADGRVLVVGGTGADGRAVASVEIYDPAVD